MISIIKEKAKREYIKHLLGIAFFVFGVLPYLIMVWYAVPVADDFTHATDVIRYEGKGITRIFNMVIYRYMHLQGVFLATALEGGIDPLHRIGFIGINIVLFVAVLITVLAIVGLMKRICLRIFPKDIASIICALAVVAGFETGVARELFFWYTGACNYTIPFFIGVLGVICMLCILEQKENKKLIKHIVGASLLGMLASGGTLQNAGYFCWIYLLFLGYDIIYRKSLKYALIPFLSTFAGALVNAVAPGNYVRKAMSYESISVLTAVKYTLIAVWQELCYLFSQTYVPVIFLVIAIVAVIFIHPVKRGMWNPVVVSAAMAASWIISTFPFCYGYASSHLEERNAATLDWFMVIGIFLFIISIANWCKLKSVTITQGTIYVTVLLVIMNLGYMQNLVPITDMPSIRCWKEILSGEAAEYHNEWITVFETIEASNEAVVEVWISEEAADRDKVIKHPGMSGNFDNWVNKGVAGFYGKENVRVITEMTD